VSAVLLAQDVEGQAMPELNAYRFAYEAVRIIDRHLEANTRHYRDWNGRLLTTLEQVVRAIINKEMEARNVAQTME
jgi:hypothetical protein